MAVATGTSRNVARSQSHPDFATKKNQPAQCEGVDPIDLARRLEVFLRRQNALGDIESRSRRQPRSEAASSGSLSPPTPQKISATSQDVFNKSIENRRRDSHRSSDYFNQKQSRKKKPWPDAQPRTRPNSLVPDELTKRKAKALAENMRSLNRPASTTANVIHEDSVAEGLSEQQVRPKSLPTTGPSRKQRHSVQVPIPASCAQHVEQIRRDRQQSTARMPPSTYQPSHPHSGNSKRKGNKPPILEHSQSTNSLRQNGGKTDSGISLGGHDVPSRWRVHGGDVLIRPNIRASDLLDDEPTPPTDDESPPIAPRLPTDRPDWAQQDQEDHGKHSFQALMRRIMRKALPDEENHKHTDKEKDNKKDEAKQISEDADQDEQISKEVERIKKEEMEAKELDETTCKDEDQTKMEKLVQGEGEIRKEEAEGLKIVTSSADKTEESSQKTIDDMLEGKAERKADRKQSLATSASTATSPQVTLPVPLKDLIPSPLPVLAMTPSPTPLDMPSFTTFSPIAQSERPATPSTLASTPPLELQSTTPPGTPPQVPSKSALRALSPRSRAQAKFAFPEEVATAPRFSESTASEERESVPNPPEPSPNPPEPSPDERDSSISSISDTNLLAGISFPNPPDPPRPTPIVVGERPLTPTSQPLPLSRASTLNPSETGSNEEEPSTSFVPTGDPSIDFPPATPPDRPLPIPPVVARSSAPLNSPSPPDNGLKSSTPIEPTASVLESVKDSSFDSTKRPHTAKPTKSNKSGHKSFTDTLLHRSRSYSLVKFEAKSDVPRPTTSAADAPAIPKVPSLNFWLASELENMTPESLAFLMKQESLVQAKTREDAAIKDIVREGARPKTAHAMSNTNQDREVKMMTEESAKLLREQERLVSMKRIQERMKRIEMEERERVKALAEEKRKKEGQENAFAQEVEVKEKHDETPFQCKDAPVAVNEDAATENNREKGMVVEAHAPVKKKKRIWCFGSK